MVNKRLSVCISVELEDPALTLTLGSRSQVLTNIIFAVLVIRILRYYYATRYMMFYASSCYQALTGCSLCESTAALATLLLAVVSVHDRPR